MFGKDSVIVAPKKTTTNIEKLNFYTVLLHFLKKGEIKTAFGCSLDPHAKFIRDRIKISLLENLNHNSFTSILESDNQEAFYNATTLTNNFLGVELRYEKPLATLDLEEELLMISGEIREEKKKIFSQRDGKGF